MIEIKHNLFGAALFLGFPVDDSFAKTLETVDAQLAALFIRKDASDYLQEVIYRNVRYFGKFAGEISDIVQLRLLEANIYSLLKKIVPHYQSEKIPLLLFPVSTSSS